MDDYIKRPDAVEEIRGLDDTMFVCVSKDECNGMRSMKERAMSALERIPPADVWPAWRSTETDPPKIGEPVLIARKIRHNETVLVEPAVFRPDGTWKAIGHKIKPSSVRHWMPMPEPPKESEI